MLNLLIVEDNPNLRLALKSGLVNTRQSLEAMLERLGVAAAGLFDGCPVGR